jgi:hypothetical protein
MPVTTFAIEIARGYRAGAAELSGAALTVLALVGGNLASRGIRYRRVARGNASQPGYAAR